MAYVSKELKAKVAEKVKPLLKKYGLTGSLAIRNYSTLVLNIRAGKIDFLKEATCNLHGREYIDVNPYYYKEHFVGKAAKFLAEVYPILNEGNFDNSDPQTDYFHVGWYVDVNIGRWDKPYELKA